MVQGGVGVVGEVGEVEVGRRKKDLGVCNH